MLGNKQLSAAWGQTCTEGRSVVHVRGFSEGAVCAAHVMMVSANHHGSLGNRGNTTRCRQPSDTAATAHALTETLPFATARLMASAMATLPFWSE